MRSDTCTYRSDTNVFDQEVGPAEVAFNRNLRAFVRNWHLRLSGTWALRRVLRDRQIKLRSRLDVRCDRSTLFLRKFTQVANFACRRWSVVGQRDRAVR
jgi:hypothetical protein